MTGRCCPMTFVHADGSEEKPCTRQGFHGPFHATETETMTRIPDGAWVKPKRPASVSPQPDTPERTDR